MATASVTLSSYNLLIDGDGYADGFLGIDVRGAEAVLVSPTPAGTLPTWNVVLDVIGQKPYTIDMRTVTYPGWGSSEAGAKRAVADISAILAIAPIAGGGGVQSVNSGTDITVDNTDPLNPIVNYTGGGGGGTTWGSITGTLSAQTDLQAALDLKADLASPALTGSPTAPTQSALDNSTKIATTAYADGAVTTGVALKANIASPTFTGVPAAPTAAPGTSTTQLATTAFVTTADNLKANIASPTFTGTPAGPTAAVGTNTTQLATTAFVAAAIPIPPTALSSNFTTTSTTNVDVTGLSTTVVATGSYDIELIAMVQTSNAAGTLSVSATVPAGASIVGVRNQGINGGTLTNFSLNADDAFSLGNSPGAANTSVILRLSILVVTTGTSGVVQIRMASGNASHTARMMAGSSMIVTKTS